MMGGRGWTREGRIFLGLMAASAASVGGIGGLGAQEVEETRVLAIVDYVAGTDFYLAVGTEQGVRESDTLPVYDGQGEERRLLGTFYIVSATGRRSVANVLGEPFEVERGALVYLGVPPDRVPSAQEAGAAAEVDPALGPARGPEGDRAQAPPALPPRFHGRVSLDYDAYRTTTRWGEGPDAEDTRSFNTPTFRLQTRGRNLPGGLALGVGMRISHRMSSDDVVQPVTSTRIYQIDLEKRFDVVPLEMHLGRFNSRFEEFSGFWDGLLLRLGPEAFGGGVAVGFEPRWSNEGFGTDRPKVLGFVDFRAGGDGLSYSGAFSFLGIRPRNELPDRTSLGLTQRLRFGRVWIHQRLEVDRDPAGTQWEVSRVQLDGSMRLVAGLEAYAGWRRWRYLPLWSPGAELGPVENRGHAGLSYWGRSGGGSVDLSLDRPQEGDGGRTVSGSFYLVRTPVPGIGFGSSASYWTRADDSSFLVSPEIRASVGPFTLRGGHRFYRIQIRGGKSTTQFSDLSLTVPVGGGVFIRVRGSTQWGGDLSSDRLYASIWKGF
jgi:hypothetical protein